MKTGGVKYLLIDIDGVLRTGESAPIPGAVKAVDFLRDRGIPHLFVSNVTRSSRRSLAGQLAAMGFSIDAEDLFIASAAAADYIASVKKNARVFLLAEGDTNREFEAAGIKVTRKEEPVDFVVIGYDRNFTYGMLSIAFRLVMNGAGLIAINADRTFMRDGCLCPATGLAAKGLEYCTGREALVIGKPSRAFFDAALKKLGAKPHETAMVGDFLEGDIIGAMNAGMSAIMVKTGSYDAEAVKKSSIKPDVVIGSIAELPGLLSKSL